MKIKGILIIIAVIILLITIIPWIINFVVWSSNLGSQPLEKNTEKSVELIEDLAIPWWVSLINRMAKWGPVGAILIIILVIFLIRTKLI